jgi:hypothetical protein
MTPTKWGDGVEESGYIYLSAHCINVIDAPTPKAVALFTYNDFCSLLRGRIKHWTKIYFFALHI